MVVCRSNNSHGFLEWWPMSIVLLDSDADREICVESNTSGVNLREGSSYDHV